jgi:hypothetical protein
MKKFILPLLLIISSNSFAAKCVVLFKGGEWDLYQDKVLMGNLSRTALKVGYQPVFEKNLYSGRNGQPIVDKVDFTLNFVGVGATNGHGGINSYFITKSKFKNGEGFIDSANSSSGDILNVVRRLLTPDCK